MRTGAGRDWQCRVMADTASSASGIYAPGNYMGITADSAAPSLGSTVLAGELTGGTMGRAQCTYAHTDGSASYTLTKTWTADRNVTIAKMGIFNAVSGGVLVFETLISSPAPMGIGDTLVLTETVTL